MLQQYKHVNMSNNIIQFNRIMLMVHGAGECLGPVRDISKRLIFFRIFSDYFPNKWKDSWQGLSEMHAKNTSEVLKAFLRMFLNLQCKLFLMFFSFYAKMEQSCNNNQQIFWFSTLESISVKTRPTLHLPRPVSILINTSPVDWPHDHYRTITISAEKCKRRFYMSIL